MIRPKKGWRHTKKTKEKISLSNTGEKSSQWKGDNIKYQAIHSWLRSRYGNANKCENVNCQNKSKEYQWSLKKGYNYERKRKNFEMLCRSCHKIKDMTKETRKKISKALTQHTNCKINDCNKPHLAKGYCITHYNTIYRKKL